MEHNRKEFENILTDYIKHSEVCPLDIMITIKEVRLDNNFIYFVYAEVNNERRAISSGIKTLEEAMGRVAFLEHVAKMMFQVKTVYQKQVTISEDPDEEL